MVSAAMFSGTGWQHDVLGWMFTYLIHSSVLIVGVWVLTRALPRISLDTKETMWRVALFGGLATSLVQAGFGLTPLPGNFDMPDAMVAKADADGAPLVAAPASPGEQVVDRKIVEHRAGELTITTVREKKVAPAMAATGHGPLQASSWPWIILGLVTAGSLFALGRLGLAGHRLRKQLQGRRDVIEDPVLETHLALCAKAELTKRPRLSASTKLRSPVALLRNEICLPERAVDSLSQLQQQGMLAHELAHLLRRDPAWRIGIAIYEALFFFQPLNHFARRKLNEVAEFQCDDWAARNTGTGVHLAKCLAEVASWLDGGPPSSAIVTAMAVPSSPIVQRITRLLGTTREHATGHTATRVAFTVFTLGAVTWFVPGVGYAQPSAHSDAVPARGAEAGVDGLRFVDRTDADYDQSTLLLQTDDESVQVHVRARKPAPPPPPESVPLAERERGDRLQITIRGGLWGGGVGWCGGMCGAGMFLDLEWLEGLEALEGLDALIDTEVHEGLFGGRHHRPGEHWRAEADRARAAADRARAAAERARAAASRARRRHDRDHRSHDRRDAASPPEAEEPSSSTRGWFGLMRDEEAKPSGAASRIVEL